MTPDTLQQWHQTLTQQHRAAVQALHERQAQVATLTHEAARLEGALWLCTQLAQQAPGREGGPGPVSVGRRQEQVTSHAVPCAEPGGGP